MQLSRYPLLFNIGGHNAALGDPPVEWTKSCTGQASPIYQRATLNPGVLDGGHDGRCLTIESSDVEEHLGGCARFCPSTVGLLCLVITVNVLPVCVYVSFVWAEVSLSQM